MSTISLTPQMLDSHLWDRSLDLSTENRPFQRSSISPLKYQSSYKSFDHRYHSPTDKSTHESSTAYRYVPKTRSSCGKALVKLYPYLYGDAEEELKSHSEQKSRIVVHKIEEILRSRNQSMEKAKSSAYATEAKVQPVDPKEIVRKMHADITEFIGNKKYRQAMSRLYDCERFIYTHKIDSISLKTYTNYLIVLTYYKAAKYDKCIEAVKKSIEAYEEFDLVAEQYILHVKHLWAKSLYAKGEYLSAIKVLTELVQNYYKTFGNKPSNNTIFGYDHMLTAKGDIGECYMAANLIKDAIKAYKQVVSTSGAYLKKQTIILNSWNQLGNCFIRENKSEKALECYLKADEHLKLHNVRVDDDVKSKLYLNIGKLFVQQKQFDKAMEYIEKAKDIRIKINGETSTAVLSCYDSLAQAAYLQKKYAEAYHNYARCYEIAKVVSGEKGPKAAHYLLLCAAAKSHTLDFADAVSMYEYVLNLYKDKFGEHSEQTAGVYLRLLPLYLKAGSSQIAFDTIDLLIQNLDSRVSLVHKEYEKLIETMQQVGEVLLHYQHYPKAITIFKKSLQLLKQIYKGKCHKRIETYKAYYSLGTAYMNAEKEISNAYNYMNLALQVADSLCGKDSAESAAAYFAIGKLYKMTGDSYNARNHFKVAEDILGRKEGQQAKLEEVRKELLTCSKF